MSYTGYVVNEINKLATHAKWDDETLADLIEGFAELEEPDLSPLPSIVDELLNKKVNAKGRVDHYLGNYFSSASDEEVSILVYLAGELPERDFTSLKEGDDVYWLDPDEHQGNGWYQVAIINANEEFPISDDTVIVIRNQAGSEAEVPPFELR